MLSRLLFTLLLLQLVAALLLLLELVDLLGLVGCHAESGTIVLRLVKDLRNEFLTLPNELLLALVRHVQVLVNLLVLLLEGLQILALKVLAEEFGELLLNTVELFLREAERVNLLRLLDLEVVGLVIDTSIVHIVVHLFYFSGFNSKIITVQI